MRAIWHSTASKGAIGQRQGGDVALTPLDVATDPARHGEHRLVEVHADNMGRPGTLGRDASDNASPAGDVEDLLAGADAGGVTQDRRPLGEEGRHERRLVGFGRVESMGIWKDSKGLAG